MKNNLPYLAHLVEFRPPRIAICFVLFAVAAHIAVPISLHPALPATALLFGIAGFALMIRAWWLFKLSGTAICPTETATTLITHDVYSFTRNPMYLGMLLMLAGLALSMASAPFYAATVGYGIVIDRVFCPYEERKAVREFGKDYAAYTRRVRRWM